MFKHNHLIKVYYRDVDQMGIVYYTRYLEYFEEARTELLDSLGLTVSLIEDRGIQLPVIDSQCDYKRGAKLEDKQVIEASISEIPKVEAIVVLSGMITYVKSGTFSGNEWADPDKSTYLYGSTGVLCKGSKDMEGYNLLMIDSYIKDSRSGMATRGREYWKNYYNTWQSKYQEKTQNPLLSSLITTTP